MFCMFRRWYMANGIKPFLLYLKRLYCASKASSERRLQSAHLKHTSVFNEWGANYLCYICCSLVG